MALQQRVGVLKQGQDSVLVRLFHSLLLRSAAAAASRPAARSKTL
jgi:hypothetical protein